MITATIILVFASIPIIVYLWPSHYKGGARPSPLQWAILFLGTGLIFGFIEIGHYHF